MKIFPKSCSKHYEKISLEPTTALSQAISELNVTEPEHGLSFLKIKSSVETQASVFISPLPKILGMEIQSHFP